MNWKKWLGILATIAAVGFVIYSVALNGSEEDATMTVRTAQLEKQDIAEYVSTEGMIQPISEQEVVGQGLVIDVKVEEGDEVSEGDVLAEYAEIGEVKADFNGTVTVLNIESEAPDTNAQMGQPSIKVESLNHLEVGLDLSQNEAPDVKQDQKVTMTYHSDELHGHVSNIAQAALESSDASSAMLRGGNGNGNKTLPATVTFDDDQDTENLIPGFDIDVDIKVDSSEDALVIPIEALNFDEDSEAYVFVVDDDVAKQVTIKTGIQSNLVIEVLEGDLSEGDEVILSPDEKLSDGDKVAPESEDTSSES